MPLVWLALAFSLGILLAAGWGQVSAAGWLGLAALSIAGAWLVRRWGGWLINRWAGRLASFRWLAFAARLVNTAQAALAPVSAGLLLVALCLGAARFAWQRQQAAAESLYPYNDLPQGAVLEGWLAAGADVRDGYALLRVQVERLHPAGEPLFTPVDGMLLALVSPAGDWQYGDRLRLEGLLETPPELDEFSYRDYLARQGIQSYLRADQVQTLGGTAGNALLRGLDGLRQRALALAYRLWSGAEAALFAGVLLGIDSGLPAGVRQAFQNTGTAHIIAISGFNISLLAGLFIRLCERVLGRPRWLLSSLLTALLLGAYTLLVGGEPAVVRAAIMGTLALAASQIGRGAGLNALGAAGLLMALLNPQVLWEPGFQLSFSATLGLILYAQPLEQAFTRLAGRWLNPLNAQRLAKPVGEFFLYTLAAQLLTLPVVAAHFQRLSLSALLANPLVLPAQPPLMTLGGLALLVGLIHEGAGQVLAGLAWVFALYTVRVVEALGSAGGVWIIDGFDWRAALLFYAALFSATAWWAPLKAWFARQFSTRGAALRPLALLSLAAGALLVWGAVLRQPDGRLHVRLLPVSGQGRSAAAVLIETPGGRRVLVGGGARLSLLADELGRWLPFHDRQLDYLVVALPDENHTAALPGVLERFPVGAVLWAGPTHGNPEARQAYAAVQTAGIPLELAQTGQALDLGGGGRLTVLAVSGRGATLLLEYGSFRLLLPFGLDFDDLETLQTRPDLRDLSAVLLADSGYAPLNPPEWLAHLNPQVTLLSVALDDRDGLPDQEALAAAQEYNLLRTDQNGWIGLSTDGEKLWVEVERK